MENSVFILIYFHSGFFYKHVYVRELFWQTGIILTNNLAQKCQDTTKTGVLT